MTRKEAEAVLAQARAMDAQRAAFEYAKARFPDPAICEGCGYPLTNHPRMGCAFVDGHKP